MSVVDSNEIWLPVVGYEGIYSVSSLGRIRMDRCRPHAKKKVGDLIATAPNRDGYLMVNLTPNPGSKRKRHQVHVLVARAFLGPCPPGHEVNHKFGVTTDNRVSELEYVTRSQNQRHAIEVLGKGRTGERNHFAKLTSETVRAIREYVASGATLKEAGTKFNTHLSNVSLIVRRKKWRHVA